jgi:hypothetical protein
MDVEHCRTMNRLGTVNIWAVEPFGMYVHNGIANITGRTIAGTSVLPEEYYFGCSGQWQYRLSEDGRRTLRAEYSAAKSPHEVHQHRGRLCRSHYRKFLSAVEPHNLIAYSMATINVVDYWVG